MQRKSKIIRCIVLAAYSAIILILVLNHEYWFDEAQAWNIARDNDIMGIIGLIKYEGHPPLWHLVLKIFISLGCSYAALGLISWGIATITAAVILFALPIKPYLKAALLLSSGMLYVNTVISRVYVLILFLLAVIAAVYPKRKKHPIIFGLLIALLANTHIVMCGLAGIMGAYMLIDYFKDFKKNTRKQNVLNTVGLALTGVGAVVLMVPMLGCLSTNSLAAQKDFGFSQLVTSFFSAFAANTDNAAAPNLSLPFGFLLSIGVQLLLIAALICAVKNRKMLVMEVLFTLSYLVISGAVWSSSPNRGSLLLYSLVMIFVICREEPVSEKKKEGSAKSGIRRIFEWSNPRISALLSAALLLTAPSGIKYACQDLAGEFSPYKAAAAFIEENISENALLVSESDDFSALLIYLPERKIYSVQHGDFYTYCSHKVVTEEPDRGALEELAENYSEVYFISAGSGAGDFTVYSNENCIPFVLGEESIVILKYFS